MNLLTQKGVLGSVGFDTNKSGGLGAEQYIPALASILRMKKNVSVSQYDFLTAM
jgi:hypothetical protein